MAMVTVPIAIIRKFFGMINLTRLNRDHVVVNCDLIEIIEITPDTVLSMTTGQRIMVLESPSEVVERVVAFRRRIAGLPSIENHDGAAHGDLKA